MRREGKKKRAKIKKGKKIRGRRAKTGSQPNQFGLAESGCTISHQSTFSTLSDLPSIHRGHPLCTLLRNKTRRRKRRDKRERKKKTHTLFTLCGKETRTRKWHSETHPCAFVKCLHLVAWQRPSVTTANCSQVSRPGTCLLAGHSNSQDFLLLCN